MSFTHLDSIFRNYDVRGAYPAEIHEGNVRDIARALVDIYGPTTVVVGYDNRPSTQPLFRAFCDGVTMQGADVIDLGMVTTPMLYLASGTLEAGAAVMITASHMPSEYNGLKICIDDALPIGLETGLVEVRDRVEAGGFRSAQRKGRVTSIDIKPQWRARLQELAPLRSDSRVKVVVDPANAVGILELETLAQYTSLEVASIFDTFDHTAPNHEANPMKRETLTALSAAVIREEADIGIAFDGDADRIGIVDETGASVPQDMIGALVAEELINQHGESLVLHDVRSSKRVAEVVKRAGGTPFPERVGHTYIRHSMRKHNAVFALELSGHHFFRDMYFSEGGILPALMLIEMMQKTDSKLSALVAEHLVYAHTGEINSEVSRPAEEIYADLVAAFPKAHIDRIDGLTLTSETWWCNVRPSANDPVLRLNLEADSKAVMEQKRDAVLSVIRG